MIGKTISHYKILDKLGEGGMGVVYKAEDTKLKRQVALKFLPSELTQSDEWKERFLREAQAAAALSHPNICTIHEIDETEGQAFIAMEYVEGHSLTEKIQSGPLDVDEVVKIALRVAEGLRHAHKRGIVHRDIKPANIMITEDGQAKIMDFGLAKLAGKTRLTKTATVMGTVAFMSPEQARGDSTIDHRTDVWSLGVLLYEMLTGVLPFDAGTDTGLIYKIINEDPEPIRNHRGDVPQQLESVIEKMIQKDPQSRYEDTKELIADLESVKSRMVSVTKESTPSIAVLPFANMSADPEQEYFCDGLAEELINALTQIEDLRVIARTSAFSFKDKNVNVREIGRELNVETILEGSVRKAGNRLRITAQLVTVAQGHHLWSERYDREMEDVFAIQDDITQAIVEKLKPRLLHREKAKIAKRQTVDLEVYDLYLKGRWFWNKRTEQGLRKSIEYFEQAIEKDPNYALAYAGLADVYIVLPTWTPEPPKGVYLKAKELTLKTLEIDDGIAEAHTSLGFLMGMCDHDWKGAEREFKRAIELNPGYGQAHSWYAVMLSLLERFDEALKEAEQALELDPLSLTRHFYAALILNNVRDYDQAIEVLQRTLEMDPNFPTTRFLLGDAYAGKSMYEEALAEYQKEATFRTGVFSSEIGTGIVYARIGKRGKAEHILDDLLRQSEDKYITPYGLAKLCFALGENDKGFEWLEKAYEEFNLLLGFIKVDAGLDGMRSDPRFIELLKKMNLDQ